MKCGVCLHPAGANVVYVRYWLVFSTFDVDIVHTVTVFQRYLMVGGFKDLYVLIKIRITKLTVSKVIQTSMSISGGETISNWI